MLLSTSGIEKWSTEISSSPQLKLICQFVQKSCFTYLKRLHSDSKSENQDTF